jgi:hypothetical protein
MISFRYYAVVPWNGQILECWHKDGSRLLHGAFGEVSLEAKVIIKMRGNGKGCHERLRLRKPGIRGSRWRVWNGADLSKVQRSDPGSRVVLWL